MEELLDKLKEILIKMIPEKWERIDLYASCSGKDKPGKQGELFFYFLPISFFKSEYVNCYEVPSQYNIDEEDYLEYINKLYLIIKKMNKLYMEKNIVSWSNLTLNMNKRNEMMKIEYSFEDLDKIPFSSYERHIIWRYTNLNIFPRTKEEKKIIERYHDFLSKYNIQKEVKYIQMILPEKQNKIDYGTVLNIDEAINGFKN